MNKIKWNAKRVQANWENNFLEINKKKRQNIEKQ